MEEALACNICGVKVNAAQLRGHLNEPSHILKKKELEAKLGEVRSQGNSSESVASLWTASTSEQ